MRYTYDTYRTTYDGSKRVDTTTRLEEIEARPPVFWEAHVVHVHDNIENRNAACLQSAADVQAWRETLERVAAWKPERVDPLPEHDGGRTFVDDDGFHRLAKEAEGLPGANLPLHVLRGSSGAWDEMEVALARMKEFGMITGQEIPPISASKDHVNPRHYKTHAEFGGEVYQWLETTCREGRYLRNPDEFCAAVELQVRKYLDRLGGKDDETQEVLKAMWYLMFLAAFMKNGKKPILVRDIEGLLREHFPK